MKNQIDLFVEDLENRVAVECRLLRNEAIPRAMMKKYILQIGWREPELATYLKKRMERELGEAQNCRVILQYQPQYAPAGAQRGQAGPMETGGQATKGILHSQDP